MHHKNYINIFLNVINIYLESSVLLSAFQSLATGSWTFFLSDCKKKFYVKKAIENDVTLDYQIARRFPKIIKKCSENKYLRKWHRFEENEIVYTHLNKFSNFVFGHKLSGIWGVANIFERLGGIFASLFQKNLLTTRMLQQTKPPTLEKKIGAQVLLRLCISRNAII